MPGERWGIVGPNGAGKSTLLGAILGIHDMTTGHVAVKTDADVGYLEQTGVGGSDTSVRTEVMSRMGALAEAQKALTEATERVEGGDYSEEALEALGEAQTQFEEKGGYTAEETVSKVLGGLGFDVKKDLDRPCSDFSGGWQMRIALARLLLSGPDVLFLDEPTNHLDVQKQQWLCDFLTGPQCEHVTTLVVSHDSKFLNKVLSDVIHYENMRLKRYTGNLDQFVEQCPMAKAYFSIHDTEMKFTFPVPGPLEGVKSRTKAILQAKNITFTYPTYRDRVLYLLRRPIGATVARQIPVLKVTCSNHVSVTCYDVASMAWRRRSIPLRVPSRE